MKNAGGPLDNQTLQTEWKTALLAIVQLHEYEAQTLGSSDLVVQPAVCKECKIYFLATAHDCETGLFTFLKPTLFNLIDYFLPHAQMIQETVE